MTQGFDFYLKLDFENTDLEKTKSILVQKLSIKEAETKNTFQFFEEEVITPEYTAPKGYKILLGEYEFCILDKISKLSCPGGSLSFDYAAFYDFIAKHPYLSTLSARGFDEYHYDGVDNPFLSNGFSNEIHPITQLTKNEAQEYNYDVKEIPADFVKETISGGLFVSLGIHGLYSEKYRFIELKDYFAKVKKK